MPELDDSYVAFVVANEGVEQAELTHPWAAVLDAGASPVLIAPRPGSVQAYRHLDKADTFQVDLLASDVDVEHFDALVLPGGVANVDSLRLDRPAVAFVRAFFATGRPVGVVCHGAWTLIEADCVRGRTLTSWPSLATDIRNAGGNWVDREVRVCNSGPNTLVSSRKPDDLPAFSATLIEVVRTSTTSARVG